MAGFVRGNRQQELSGTNVISGGQARAMKIEFFETGFADEVWIFRRKATTHERPILY